MAKTIELEMITPEKVALKATADYIVLPAHEVGSPGTELEFAL